MKESAKIIDRLIVWNLKSNSIFLWNLSLILRSLFFPEILWNSFYKYYYFITIVSYIASSKFHYSYIYNCPRFWIAHIWYSFLVTFHSFIHFGSTNLYPFHQYWNLSLILITFLRSASFLLLLSGWKGLRKISSVGTLPCTPI